jgi:hypothetical protein
MISKLLLSLNKKLNGGKTIIQNTLKNSLSKSFQKIFPNINVLCCHTILSLSLLFNKKNYMKVDEVHIHWLWTFTSFWVFLINPLCYDNSKTIQKNYTMWFYYI